MKTAKQIRKQCEKDIKALQKACKHLDSTEMANEYAPGHYTGVIVTVCDMCEKILYKKFPKIR